MESDEEEIMLTTKAVTDPEARKKLHKYVRPWVEEQADMLIQRKGHDPVYRAEMIEAGMQSFDKAFNIYLKHNRHVEEPWHPFSLYFAWWARQAMVAYLDHKDDVPFDISDV
jgi:hypothetical protein